MMDLTTIRDANPYVVIRQSFRVGGADEIIARCEWMADAESLADKHPGAYIHNTGNGTDYYRHEHMVVEYSPREV